MAHPASPRELHAFWRAFAEAKDAPGLASLYEEEAVLIVPDGRRFVGKAQILGFFTEYVARTPQFSGIGQRAPIVADDLAVCSMRLANGGTTCEVARRQADGSWRWVIDLPRFSELEGSD